MVRTVLLMCLLPGLSDPEWSVRESVAAAFEKLGTVSLVTGLWVRCQRAEAKFRLGRIRSTLIVREVDEWAKPRGYPSADDLGWPTLSDEWGDWTFPPEFYRADTWIDDGQHWNVPDHRDQCNRTRKALILYVSRTGDWKTVRGILAK